MGFRKDKVASLEWRDWLVRYQPTLVLCGIPEDAYETQRNWHYFLDHASMSTEKEMHWFSWSCLSSEQLKNFREFLEREYGVTDYPPYILTYVRGQLQSF